MPTAKPKTQTLTCTVCKTKFPRPNARGPAPKYCSDAHRQVAFIDRNFVKKGDTVYLATPKGASAPAVFRTRKEAVALGGSATPTKLR